MAEISSGISAGDKLTVDPISKSARATLYDVNGNPSVLAENAQPATVSGSVMTGMNDRSALPIRLDRLGGQASALHTMLLSESFEGTTLHASRWAFFQSTLVAGMTTAGGLNFNSTNLTTASAGYTISSTRRFLLAQRTPLQAKFRARMNHVNNTFFEIGFGDALTATGPNSTGAFWQMTASGILQPVVTYNGIDQTGTDIRSLINNTNFYTYDVFKDDDEIIFTCQDTATGLILSKQTIKLPAAGIRLLSTSQVSVIARQSHTATVPASAPQLIVSDIVVTALDFNQFKNYQNTMATLARTSIENPFTGASIVQYTNNAEPANAALSNTVAGYSTLGGKFQFLPLASAATDYALFGFQVPVPANFICTGIDIDSWNLGAAVATTPTLLTWAIGVGSTAVSLATANISRIPVGSQVFAIGAPIGAAANRISKAFTTPIPCAAGRFFHIILRLPLSTATVSQVIAGMVNIEGYFE